MRIVPVDLASNLPIWYNNLNSENTKEEAMRTPHVNKTVETLVDLYDQENSETVARTIVSVLPHGYAQILRAVQSGAHTHTEIKKEVETGYKLTPLLQRLVHSRLLERDEMSEPMQYRLGEIALKAPLPRREAQPEEV